MQNTACILDTDSLDNFVGTAPTPRTNTDRVERRFMSLKEVDRSNKVMATRSSK